MGHDINFIGYAGLLHATGAPDGPPVLPAVQVGDFGGGMAAALGTVAALVEAARTGRGRLLDVSMLDVVTSWLGVVMSWFLATGQVPPRGGCRSPAAWPATACTGPRTASTWPSARWSPGSGRRCARHSRSPSLVDRHFAPPGEQEALAANLQAIFATRTRDEWVERLAHLEACLGPVNDVSEAVRDPQVGHRGLVAHVDGEAVGPGPALGLPGDERAHRPASGSASTPTRSWPRPGCHRRKSRRSDRRAPCDRGRLEPRCSVVLGGHPPLGELGASAVLVQPDDPEVAVRRRLAG